MSPSFRSDGFFALQFAPGANQSSALLQALAELFVANRRHNRAELRRFEELVQHLIGSVDKGERRRFAQTVATRTDLPESILLRLAYDEAEIAEPLIRLSPQLTDKVLSELAGLSEAHARAVAERLKNPPVEVVTETPDPAAVNRPPKPAPVAKATVSSPASKPAANSAPTAGVDRVAEGFFDLDHEGRRALVARLARESWMPDMATATAALSRFSPAAGHELVELAKTAALDAVADRLASALKVSAGLARRIFVDKSGEALLVAARSLGMSESAASELLVMLAQRRAGQRYDFLPLIKFYRGLSKAVADRLLASWIAADAAAEAKADPKPQRPAPRLVITRRVRLGPAARRQKATPNDDSGSSAAG